VVILGQKFGHACLRFFSDASWVRYVVDILHNGIGISLEGPSGRKIAFKGQILVKYCNRIMWPVARFV
jgi:hypothetical protein